MKCCICKKSIRGYGHNPYPIKQRGACCDNCNNYVILTRLSSYGMIDKDSTNKMIKEWLENDK